MADNFNMKQYLAENKLGAYSKLKENSSSDDLVVKWTKRYLNNEKNDPYFYTEKGLADGFEVIGGQKVKEIIGYDEDDDDEVIGYIYSKSKKDIETEYSEDDLDNAFTSALNSMNEGEAAYEYEKGKAAGEKEEKEELKEYEVIYVVRDGRCYRKDDEGNMDEVNMSYCRRFAESEEKVEEAISVKSVQKAEMSLQNILRNIATNANIPTDEKEGLINALGELQDFVDEVGYDSEMEDEYVSDYSRRRASELKEDEHKDPIKEGGDIFADIDDDIAYGSDSKEDAIEYLEEIIDYCQKKIVELENEQGFEDEEDDLDEAFGGKNPEGDKLVLRFLQGVSKKFNYPVAQAATFVKNTIKSLGY